MISPKDLNAPKTQATPTISTPIDVEKDVMPIYRGERPTTSPNPIKLLYDMAMLALIVLDLLIIFFDQIMMSAFFAKIASLLSFAGWLDSYKAGVHLWLGMIGGLFTMFLIGELLMRWAIAVYKRTYYRWFFFPFVHWYEVLGCFPLLRPLRLLRAVVIVKRLHEMEMQVVPARWIKTGKFYGHILLEELSDRVILTAVDNVRTQLRSPTTHHTIENTINKNRHDIEAVVLTLLRQELSPRLTNIASSNLNERLADEMGQAVQQALANTPELRRYLRLIPIAGSMIESQLLEIGTNVGKNMTKAVNEALLSPKLVDELMVEIAKGVAHVDTSHPALQALIARMIEDGLTAFEGQIKVQQWRHTKQLHL